MLYNPPHFRNDDRDALLASIEARGFATLVSVAEAGPIITHLPLILDRSAGPHGTLIGHVARANPHWTLADLSRPSVAIIAGPEAYVSPNWYPSKVDTGKAVPTWNYEVVHVTGTLRVHDDAAWLRAAVTRLTEKHETARPNGWQVSDAPEAYIAAQLKGIVGLSLEISELTGKSKLSQNRSEQDRAGVMAGLAADDDPASAAMLTAMRARKLRD